MGDGDGDGDGEGEERGCEMGEMVSPGVVWFGLVWFGLGVWVWV